MSTAKLLVLVLGLAVVAFAVKYALSSTLGGESDRAGISEPKRQLDSVRARARELEQEQQRSADRADVER